MPTATTPNYLDPQTLAAIGPLELRARMIVEGMMTGMHRSPYQGYSVEFAQHRQYAPGDDIRHLDWKVYGRTDKLYLKQYQKETNLDLVVMVDNSGSMGYSSKNSGASGGTGGSWTKYDAAASAAAAMCYMALKQQDRVGLVLFDNVINASTRMSSSHDHWRAVVESLAAGAPARDEQQQEDRPTDVARVFDQTLGKIARRSILVFISDLFDDPAALERGLARLHHRRHDLIVIQTLDPAELSFPFRAPSDFLGLEGEGKLGLDPAALRKAYIKIIDEHVAKVQEITSRFRFDYLLLDTSKSLGPPLSHFLARRAAMAGRRR